MRIAIYHNDPVQAQTLRQLLSDAGHRVFVESSRYGLLVLLDRSTMDIVITEWHGILCRDNVSGHWLIREAQNAAVIFTTIDAGAPKVEKWPKGQFVAFVQIPIPSRLLIGEVNAMIRQAFPWQTTAQFDIGPYSIDLIRRTIFRAGEQLPMPNDGAFRLAFCMLVNAGRRLSRDYLKEFVGGAAATSQGRYIDTLVGSVKKLLLARTRTGLRIRSICGFGYVLELGNEANFVRLKDGVESPADQESSECMKM